MAIDTRIIINIIKEVVKLIKITNINTYITCPDGINLIVVRVDTNQPGLYGLGCATYTQRCKAVVTVIEEYIKPLILGRNVMETQELWNLMNNNGYWRNGPVVNNAVSGVDMALWDIKGKIANLPVYDLIGGKSREAVALYCYANGESRDDILEKASKRIEEGFHYIRLQYFPMQGYSQCQRDWRPDGAKKGFYQDPHAYIQEIIGLFGDARSKLGFEPELIHDVHERIPVSDAISLAKELEPMKLFFLEDLLSPEYSDYYKIIKNVCTTPIAHGELCTNPLEWKRLISEHLIDFIRVHFSMIGGFTPAIKLAHFSEAFGVRTAWHGPTDMNPVGHVAQMHMDLVSPNFGIQAWSEFADSVHEVFEGIPKVKNGYAYVNDKPGFGIEFNEVNAKKYPHQDGIVEWTQFRHTDGSLFTP